MDLNTLWFLLLGIFLAGYAILDGFDLGVGILHPLARSDRDRRIFMNAIGPIWDGNEVWLIVFGGALFAGFPEAYATFFSTFYLPFMAVLFGLILRAVSLEFRSKFHAPWWRRGWDAGFFVGSLLASFVFGVAAGNSLGGIPLNERGIFTGALLDLLNPYALLVGVFAVSLFAMHGSIFLYLRTPHGSDLHRRLREWMWHTWGLFLVLYVLTTIYTLIDIPWAAANIRHYPWAPAVVVLNVLAIANIPRAIYAERPGQAFASSAAVIAALVVLLGLALYPNMIVASNHPPHSLTVYNAASGPLTLTIMAIIAAIGTPLVLIYTATVYWTFRGRVELSEQGY